MLSSIFLPFRGVKVSIERILLNNIQTEIRTERADNLNNLRRADSAELDAMRHKSNADSQARKSKNLVEENKRLEEENEFLRELLTRPMSEIAKENGLFREAYHKQQEAQATWMVSQRAFKEIAMKYGIQAGKSVEDIALEADKAEEQVLTDSTKYGNNIGKGGIDGLYIKDIIKRKLSRTPV